MEKDKKELIEKEDNFFKKLLLKIKNILKKEDIAETEDKVDQEKAKEIVNNLPDEEEREFTKEERQAFFEELDEMEIEEVPEYHYESDIDSEAEKIRVKKLYEDVKNEMVNIESLSGIDLLLVEKLLRAELDITKRKLT